MEEAEQAEEVKKINIVREETIEEIAAETVTEEEWISWRRRKRSRHDRGGGGGDENKNQIDCHVSFFCQCFPPSNNRGSSSHVNHTRPLSTVIPIGAPPRGVPLSRIPPCTPHLPPPV